MKKRCTHHPDNYFNCMSCVNRRARVIEARRRRARRQISDREWELIVERMRQAASDEAV